MIFPEMDSADMIQEKGPPRWGRRETISNRAPINKRGSHVPGETERGAATGVARCPERLQSIQSTESARRKDALAGEPGLAGGCQRLRAKLLRGSAVLRRAGRQARLRRPAAGSERAWTETR